MYNRFKRGDFIFPETIPTNKHPYFTNEDDFPEPFVISNGFSFKNILVGMHAQEFTEINIVLAGTGIHYIENRRIPAKKGDVFFILPDYTHGYMGDENFEVYNITIHKRFLDKYLTDLQGLSAFSVLFKAEPLLRIHHTEPLHLTLTENQLEKLYNLLEEITQYSHPKTYESALICSNLIMVLIAKLCNCYVENAGIFEKFESKGDLAFLNTLSLIHENYKENLTIDMLAETAHLSRSAFVRKFREVCNMSPHKYIIKHRLEAAMHHLENTELSIAEIAENTGFYDTAHFTRIFKAETGFSPNMLRKKKNLSFSGKK